MVNPYKYLLIMTLLALAGCKNDSPDHESMDMKEVQKKVYTCPMHPNIIRDKPGSCPICGMDLVEKKDVGENIQDSNLQLLLKPTNEYVLSKVKTITLHQMELPIEFSASGRITYDTRFINTVSARVSGRIEKLYIKYKYQAIHKGEKLMDIYSKDLLTEQENYIFLLKNDAENKTIIDAAYTKLILMGLSKGQIDELKTSYKVISTITIYSPYTGHLHDVSSNSSGVSDNTMQNNASMPQELLIKEGMYIEKGQTVFNIYNTTKVWAVLNIYPEGQSMLKLGQKIKLHIDGTAKDWLEAKVDFIEPVFHANHKTTAIRVYLDNVARDIKIGAVVKANIITERRKVNYIPASAVSSLGINNIVFVKDDKLFKARKVILGIKTDEWIEIVSGIDKNDPIADNAQLLIDSESFVKTNTP